MSQTNFTPILLYASNTATSVPSAGNLTNSANGAEVAVNTADKRLFTKDSGGAVVELGTNPSSLSLPNQTANGVLYLNGSKVATSGSALTFDGTKLGNVGTAGGVRFEVASTTGSPEVSITSADTGTSQINFGGATTPKKGRMVYSDNSDLFYWSLNNGSEQMRLTSTGLGIGTSSPNTKLEIANAATGIPILRLSGFNSADNSQFGVIQFYNEDASQQGPNVAASIKAITAANTDGSGGQLTFATSTGTGSEGSEAVERMRLDSSGNLGLGVTPSAFSLSGFRSLEIGSVGSGIFAGPLDQNLLTNAYYNGGWKYAGTGVAIRYQMNSGEHRWYTAPSGTAGNAISFTQAMTLDASGDLMVGTTTKVPYSGNPGSTNFTLSGTSNPTTARPSITLKNSDDSARAWWVIDANNGAFIGTQTNNYFGFQTNNTERARITSDGDLLVGATSASTSSDDGFKVLGSLVAGHWDPSVVTGSNSSGTSCWDIYSTATSSYRFYVTTAGVVNAVSTTITAISDQRLKENIQDIDVGLNAIMALKPRKFDWKAGKGKDIKGDRGWIAQEFEQVFPDLIDDWKDPAPEGEEPYKSVRADLIPVLVKAIQEQQALITALTARVAALEAQS